MRRALLLGLLLAAPAATRAQTGTPSAGSVTFTNTDADRAGSLINEPECLTSTATVRVSWTMAVDANRLTTPTPPFTYQLYAANKSTDAGTSCPTAPATDLIANPVGATLGNQAAQSVVDREYSTREIVAAAGLAACAVQADTSIFLCVQGSDGTGAFGTARGTITLSLARPGAAPRLDPIRPGDRALNVRWSDPAATKATWYEVRAVSLLDPSSAPTAVILDPASAFTGFDPRDPTRHSSGLITATDTRLSGLQNDVTYAVAVIAFSAAENPSDPSNVATGAPGVTLDFWEAYKDAGGQELGGCASGAAGPLGLALLAATLALVRRKK